MFSKTNKILLVTIFVFGLFQIWQLFNQTLLSSEYELLLLGRSPEFSYQQIMDLPVWIFSFVTSQPILSAITLVKIIKLFLCLGSIFFIWTFSRKLKSSLSITFYRIIIFQIVVSSFLFPFTFLLFTTLLFAIVIFISNGSQHDLDENKFQRHTIYVSLLFGLLTLTHYSGWIVYLCLLGFIFFFWRLKFKVFLLISILILFIFTSPRLLWLMQNETEVQLETAVETCHIDHNANLSILIVEDDFLSWKKLFEEQKNNHSLVVLTSNLDRQKPYLWKYKQNIKNLFYVTSDLQGEIETYSITNLTSKGIDENLDEKIFVEIQDMLHHSWFYYFSALFFWLGQWGIFLVILLLLAFTKTDWKTYRKDVLNYFMLAVASGLIIFLLKTMVDRPRPLIELGDIALNWFTPLTAHSFPSGDSQAVFTMLVPLWWLRPKLRWLIILAPLVAINRIVMGVHFPFDVLVGSIIGITTALTAKIFLWNKP